MTRRGHWRLWLFLGLLVFALATAGKWLFNGLDAAFYDLYNGPEARTAGDAVARGRLVARFRIDPARLEGEGKVYEFEEAWLEAADVPGHLLVWFPNPQRADWCYLCVRPRTTWFQGDFLFNPAPEYRQPFEVAGPGQGASTGPSRVTTCTSRRSRPTCGSWTSGCSCSPTGRGRTSRSGGPT